MRSIIGLLFMRKSISGSSLSDPHFSPRSFSFIRSIAPRHEYVSLAEAIVEAFCFHENSDSRKVLSWRSSGINLSIAFQASCSISLEMTSPCSLSHLIVQRVKWGSRLICSALSFIPLVESKTKKTNVCRRHAFFPHRFPVSAL